MANAWHVQVQVMDHLTTACWPNTCIEIINILLQERGGIMFYPWSLNDFQLGFLHSPQLWWFWQISAFKSYLTFDQNLAWMNISTNSKQSREREEQRISGGGSIVGISDFNPGQWTSTSQYCRPLEMGKISSGIDSPRIAVYYVAQKKWSRNTAQRNRFIERAILEIKWQFWNKVADFIIGSTWLLAWSNDKPTMQ